MTTTIESAVTTRLSPETLRHIFALPAAEQKALGTLLLDTPDTPPADSVGYRQAVKDELAFRIKELEAGRMETYSAEEAMAYIRQRRSGART